MNLPWEHAGGPAFPCLVPDQERHGMIHHFDPGMSLRDYFAALAMQGHAANGSVELGLKESVELAYKIADAMLAERNKETKGEVGP